MKNKYEKFNYLCKYEKWYDVIRKKQKKKMEKINIENDEKPSEWKWKSVRDCIENRKLLVNNFSRANLFILSCVAACFSLVSSFIT